jgi:hypothetical protein
MVNEMLRRLTIGVSCPHEASEVVHPSPPRTSLVARSVSLDSSEAARVDYGRDRVPSDPGSDRGLVLRKAPAWARPTEKHETSFDGFSSPLPRA